MDHIQGEPWWPRLCEFIRKLTRPRDASALYPEFATRAARATWVMNHPLSGARDGTTYRHNPSHSPRTSLSSSANPKTSKYIKVQDYLYCRFPSKAGFAPETVQTQLSWACWAGSSFEEALESSEDPCYELSWLRPPGWDAIGCDGKLIGLTMSYTSHSIGLDSGIHAVQSWCDCIIYLLYCIVNVAGWWTLKKINVSNPGWVMAGRGWTAPVHHNLQIWERIRIRIQVRETPEK
jgi:hypothetical protein